MKEPRANPRQGESTSWESKRPSLGGWIIILLLSGILGYALVGRVLDGLRIVYDSNGRPTVVADSSLNTAYSLACFGLAVGLSLICLFRTTRVRSPVPFVVFIQALIAWWSLMSVVVPRGTGISRFLVLGALPLALGITSSPPNRSSLRILTLILDVFGICNIIFSMLYPSLAQVPCRDDKCGIFGTMYSGFFIQENIAPGIMAFFLPAAIVSRSNRRCAVSLTIGALTALSSGSRTGLLSVAVSILCVVIIRYRLQRSKKNFTIPRLFWYAPLFASVLSVLVFLYAQPESLTGRGVVFEAIRNALSGPSVLYGTAWDVVPRMTDGYLTGEHGQMPHILARAGVVGGILWMAAVFSLPRERRIDEPRSVAVAILMAASVGMITEPRFELDPRSVGFTALLLVVGLLVLPSRRSTSGGFQKLPWDRASRSVLVCGAILAIVVPSVFPAMNRATTTVFMSSPSRNPVESGQALGTSQIKTLGYADAAKSPRVMERVAARVDLPVSPDTLRGALFVRVDERSTALRLQAEHVEAAVAEAMVRAWAQELSELAQTLEYRSADAPPQLSVTPSEGAIVTERRWSYYWLWSASVLAATWLIVSVLRGMKYARDEREAVSTWPKR